MKVELQSTDKIVELQVAGRIVPARVWIGKTEHGVECHAYITDTRIDSRRRGELLSPDSPVLAAVKALIGVPAG